MSKKDYLDFLVGILLLIHLVRHNTNLMIINYILKLLQEKKLSKKIDLIAIFLIKIIIYIILHFGK